MGDSCCWRNELPSALSQSLEKLLLVVTEGVDSLISKKLLSESGVGLFVLSKVSFSRSTWMISGLPEKESPCLNLDSREWHYRQRGMYISAPPISVAQSFGAVLNVKLAFYLQSLQIALSFLIFSHLGINATMFWNVPRKKVPCKEAMITIFYSLAAISANSTMSMKN